MLIRPLSARNWSCSDDIHTRKGVLALAGQEYIDLAVCQSHEVPNASRRTGSSRVPASLTDVFTLRKEAFHLEYNQYLVLV